MLAEEAISFLPHRTKPISTPTGHEIEGIELNCQPCVVSIVRAGDSLLEAVRACIPSIPVGKLIELIFKKQERP